MKRLIFNKFTSFIEMLYRRVMVYFSFLVIAIYGLGIIYVMISDPYSFEHFKKLVGSAGGTATLAGLSFYAGYMTPHQHKKPVFYDNGEQLYHATILFSVAAVIFSCVLILESSPISGLLLATITSILILIIISFFVYGLILTNIAVVRLLLALHSDYYKLLHENLNNS